MLRKWFNRGKQEPSSPPSAPESASPPKPQWEAPTVADADYYNLHLHGATLNEAEQAIRANYLLHGESGTPGAILSQQGEWVTVYVPEAVMRGVGFNRLASQIAREREDWVIGYRAYAGKGLDVHYFRGAEHLDQLAFADEGIEFEPETPSLFAELTDVSGVVPRRATQHPLDFHFALLDALGVQDAALPWPMALERHEAGTLGDSRLILVP
jgi:hypothetical protein